MEGPERSEPLQRASRFHPPQKGASGIRSLTQQGTKMFMGQVPHLPVFLAERASPPHSGGEARRGPVFLRKYRPHTLHLPDSHTKMHRGFQCAVGVSHRWNYQCQNCALAKGEQEAVHSRRICPIKARSTSLLSALLCIMDATLMRLRCRGAVSWAVEYIGAGGRMHWNMHEHSMQWSAAATAVESGLPNQSIQEINFSKWSAAKYPLGQCDFPSVERQAHEKSGGDHGQLN